MCKYFKVYFFTLRDVKNIHILLVSWFFFLFNFLALKLLKKGRPKDYQGLQKLGERFHDVFLLFRPQTKALSSIFLYII